MSKIEEIKKVANNSKSTRTILQSVLNEAIEMLTAKEVGKFDPIKEIKNKEIEEIKAFANSTVQDVNIPEILKELTDKITDAIEQYKNITNAISIKAEELEQLTGIESKVLSMASITNAEIELRERLTEETTIQKNIAKEEMNKLTEELRVKKEEFWSDIRKLKSETDEARKKEEVEYKYNFDRKKKLESDAWQDEKTNMNKTFNKELELKRKEIDEEINVVNLKSVELTKREEQLEELEAKVKDIPNVIQKSVDEAIKKTEDSVKESFGFEKAMLETKFSGERQLFESKIVTLENNAQRDVAQIADLQTKLNEAYAKIESVANNAVASASGKQYVDRLESMIKENKSNTIK